MLLGPRTAKLRPKYQKQMTSGNQHKSIAPVQTPNDMPGIRSYKPATEDPGYFGDLQPDVEV